MRAIVDIEVFVKYIIECFVAVLYVCLRTVPLDSAEEPFFVVLFILVVRRSFGFTFSSVRSLSSVVVPGCSLLVIS